MAATCRRLPRGIATAAACLSTVATAGLALSAGPALAATGPVAAYSFDEGAGSTLHDLSGSGNDGTIAGATWTAGRVGNALSFDGDRDAVTVPDSSSLHLLAGMTIEAWVRPRAVAGLWRTVALKEQPGGASYGLFAANGVGTPSGHVYSLVDNAVDGPSPLPLLSWTHLAVTWDGTLLDLYVDGSLVASRLAAGVLLPSAGPLELGGNSVWGEWFDGQIDELRVYDHALSAPELASDRARPVDTVAPSAPSGLAAGAATKSSVSLSWTAASDNVAVGGYGIYVDGALVASTGGTSFTATGLSCGATHTFAVDAYDPAGNRSPRTTVGAATGSCDSQPPTVPANLAATASAKAATLSWSPSLDDVGVAGYRVYENGAPLGTTTATAYSVSGLTCGTTYTFGVEAYDAAGNRSEQAQVAVATSECQDEPPTVPGAPTVTGATETSVSLAWAASTDEDDNLAGYDVFVGGALAGKTAATSFTVSGLACATTYTVAVDAYDSSGNHSAQATASATTAACPDTEPPTAPGSPSAGDATQTSVTLAWSESTDDVGVAGYGIYQGGARIASTASTTYTVSGLACGQSYTFAIDAYDAAGNRSAQAGVAATTAECSGGGDAASVFLSPTGSDSSPCTQAAPCRSFDRAYHVAALGDTVEVAAGTYGDQNLLFDAGKSGAQSDLPDVVFRPAPGATVVVGQVDFGKTRFQGGASHVTLRDLTVNDDVSIPGCGVPDATPCPPDAQSPDNDLTFQNLRVRGPYAFYCASCSNVSILGGVWGPDTYLPCHWSMHPEIQSASTQVKRANHILIDGATFQNFARCDSSDHTECLQVEPADDITLRNSIFKDCDTMTVNFANDLANSPSAAGFRAPNNVLIENNFFDAAHDASGGETYYALNIRECTNCTVRYNSWLQAPRLPDGEVSLNNRFVANVGPFGSAACDIRGVTFAFNVWEGAQCSSTDKDVGDLGFVNPALLDLHLRPTSPAVDAGDPSSFPAADIDGQARPLGGVPDAGADESR